MSNFVSLEDAAKKLGVSVEELVEMRSRGEIFGYRDGGSWKFKPEEIERVTAELMGDALDEDPAGSSILASESGLDSSAGSDAGGEDAGSDVSSDVALVAESSAGSDVRLVASGSEAGEEDDLHLADSDDDDDELALASDDGDDLLAAASDATSGVGSDLELVGSQEDKGSSTDSDIPLGSDLNLMSEDPSGVISGSDLSLEDLGGNESDLIKGDSDPAIDSSGLGSDLELSDGEDDLVLGGGSDLALGTDSGINLMSPSDSGISLEDEPLDLAASGISGLDLAAEDSNVEGGSAAGSAVDFQQDEEFQLSPSGSIEADDDSGSQVIELEDSSEFGDAAVALPAEEGFDAFADVEGGGLDDADALGAVPSGTAAVGTPEVPYTLLQVLSLLGILLLMCLSGILVTDVVRNMWAWSGESTLTSGFTDMVLSAFGQK
jgi:hypothetical protein